MKILMLIAVGLILAVGGYFMLGKKQNKNTPVTENAETPVIAGKAEIAESQAQNASSVKENNDNGGTKTGSSIITGIAKFEGKIPKLKTINMQGDPLCVAKYQGKPPPVSESLVLGTNRVLGNVFVRVKSGLANRQYQPPREPVVISQEGCKYTPHVFGIVKGQPIKFLNKDGLLHNVHALPKINRQFNLSMPKTMTSSKPKRFKKEEGMFRIKCDVHPWMQAFVMVLNHPFFDVTDKEGKFTIANLPEGTYQIEAWHEKLGTRTSMITIAQGETKKNIDFIFKR